MLKRVLVVVNCAVKLMGYRIIKLEQIYLDEDWISTSDLTLDTVTDTVGVNS